MYKKNSRGLTGFRVAMQGKFLVSASMCSIRSVQLSLLFIIWSKTEGIFLFVLSCTAQLLIHLGINMSAASV